MCWIIHTTEMKDKINVHLAPRLACISRQVIPHVFPRKIRTTVLDSRIELYVCGTFSNLMGYVYLYVPTQPERTRVKCSFFLVRILSTNRPRTDTTMQTQTVLVLRQKHYEYNKNYNE